MLDRMAAGPCGRGDGVARARAGRRHGAARRPAAGRLARPRLRSRAGPGPRPRPGRHQPGVPARVLGRAAGGGKAPIDLGAAAFRSSATFAPTRSAAAVLVVDLAVRPGPRAPRRSPSRSRVRTDDGRDRLGRRRHRRAASDTVAVDVRPADDLPGRHRARPSPTSPSLLHDGCAVVLVTEGHGPGERLVEVLRDHDVAARLGRRAHDAPAGRRRRGRAGQPRSTGSSRRAAGSRCSPGTTSTSQRPHGRDATPDAVAATPPGRPARADARRLRRARAARRRALRRDDPAHGGRRDPRVPRHRVRRVASAATRPTSSSSRPTSSTR